MNYYQARQRESDKRWDYTCMNDGRVWPIGYCRPYSEPVDGGIIQWRESERQAVIATKDKHHGDGHSTEEEARECYKQYCLDHHLSLDNKWDNTQHKCKVCGEYTEGFAECNHVHFDLCDKHRNRAEVEKLFSVGSSISSY